MKESRFYETFYQDEPSLYPCKFGHIFQTSSKTQRSRPKSHHHGNGTAPLSIIVYVKISASTVFHRSLILDHAAPVQPEGKVIYMMFRINVAFHIVRYIFQLLFDGSHMGGHLHWRRPDGSALPSTHPSSPDPERQSSPG